MGRKSMALERREEILAAFERCIINYGLDGATLERIANEAGVQRSIIRHYIGNRDAVVTALVERVMLGYEAQLTLIWQWVRQDQWVTQLLDGLFADPTAQGAARDRVIREIFVSGEAQYTEAKMRFVAIYEQMIAKVAWALGQVYGGSSAEKCQEVAYAIFALSSAASDLQSIGLNPDYRLLARQSAEVLVAQLAIDT